MQNSRVTPQSELCGLRMSLVMENMIDLCLIKKEGNALFFFNLSRCHGSQLYLKKDQLPHSTYSTKYIIPFCWSNKRTNCLISTSYLHHQIHKLNIFTRNYNFKLQGYKKKGKKQKPGPWLDTEESVKRKANKHSCQPVRLISTCKTVMEKPIV
ncbi:hypothetical protein LXL04_013974 [Taraxacum kok-saghyz]